MRPTLGYTLKPITNNKKVNNMHGPLRQISESASTTVTIAKIATPSAAISSYAASKIGESELAILGFIATMVFGSLGLFVNWYFRRKEDRRREAEKLLQEREDVRREEEHKATMQMFILQQQQK